MADNGFPYPLAGPVISGTLITMDQYLNAPMIMKRRVADIAAQEFFAHKIFSNGGEVANSILYSRPNPLLTDLYTARRMQEMAPGTAAPVLTFVVGVPMVALPRKIGGRFALTKEEKKSNDPWLIENGMTQAGNTIQRDLEMLALSELAAVGAAETRTFPSTQTLATSAATTFVTRTAANQPSADIARLVSTVHNEQRGHKVNSAIYNTLDWGVLQAIYSQNGGDGDVGARAMLAAHGITTVDVSVQQTQGKAKFYEAGQVGTWAYQFPLEHKQWIDEVEDDKEWHRFTVSPVYAVRDQFSFLEQTGL